MEVSGQLHALTFVRDCCVSPSYYLRMSIICVTYVVAFFRATFWLVKAWKWSE
jgi:hypothetical protein